MSKAVFLLALVAATQAHNWVNSPSRAPQASTVKPCRPRLNENPHIQVEAGQSFNVEWMTGHSGNSFTYFTIVHADDVVQMAYLNRNDLTEYFTSASDHGGSINTDPAYHKVHVKDTRAPPTTEDMLYHDGSDPLDPDHPSYIERPERFRGRGIRSDRNTTVWGYKPEYKDDDGFVEYLNPKYPFIEAMWRYKNPNHRPSEFDIANFYIPARKGVGEYVIHYYWGGYQDCTDVEVIDRFANAPYGERADGSTWKRIDHCQFRAPEALYTGCLQVVTTPQQCFDYCDSVTNCYAVNVVPYKNPSQVYHQSKTAVKVPWSHERCDGAEAEFHKAWKDGELDEDAYVCYGFEPSVETNDINGVYTISDDPEDSLFYSSCFLSVPNWNFTNGYVREEKPKAPAVWHWGDKCISCHDYEYNKREDVLPRWHMTDHCVDCAANPYLGDVYAEGVIEHEKIVDGVCDGHNGDWAEPSLHTCPSSTQCLKEMKVIGSTRVLHEECKKMVQDDLECSNTYMYEPGHRRGGYNCQCFKRDDCCSACTPKGRPRFTEWGVYSLDAATINKPDPGCSTNIKDPEGLFCCPSVCRSQGGSLSCGHTDCDKIPGPCCTTSVPPTRMCNETSPPCHIV